MVFIIEFELFTGPYWQASGKLLNQFCSNSELELDEQAQNDVWKTHPIEEF